MSRLVSILDVLEHELVELDRLNDQRLADALNAPSSPGRRSSPLSRSSTRR